MRKSVVQKRVNESAWPVLAFFALGLITLLRHEMWCDEFQGWLIARNSHSLANLFVNLKYEGHPALWYLILYVITRFTHNYFWMQLTHLALATLVIWVMWRYSTFT